MVQLKQPASLLLLLSVLVCVCVTTNAFLIGGSCKNRCDHHFDSNKDCQCNDKCSSHGDCCDDYSTLCDASTQTCRDRCGSNVDQGYTCQCNSHCLRYGDCCNDYQSLCTVTPSTQPPTPESCKTLNQMGQALWDVDVNRLSPTELDVNYQTQTQDGNTDRSSQRLFTKVDETKFSRPTFAAFFKLLDNYARRSGVAEQTSDTENKEVNTFLDAVLDTKVMATLLGYLQCQGKISTQSELKTILHKLWFEFYGRSSRYSALDSSGFEHVLVGEYKDGSTVSGFHSWLQFYKEEKIGAINYYGYMSKQNPSIIGATFKWNGRLKVKGAFFIGVSPEFDMAVYTLCYISHPNELCPIRIEGNNLAIKSFSIGDGYIGTAFIV